jgi:membrane-associated phospholipid phosphatase
VFLFLAVFTGFSRIYLSQHFLGDAVAGSLIGIFTIVIVQSLFEKNDSEWMDKNIITLISGKNA